MNNEIRPDHYRLNPEPWDVIASWGLNFDLGNAIKYISRAGKKEGTSKDEDLRKAITYLKHQLENSEEETIIFCDYEGKNILSRKQIEGEAKKASREVQGL